MPPGQTATILWSMVLGGPFMRAQAHDWVSCRKWNFGMTAPARVKHPNDVAAGARADLIERLRAQSCQRVMVELPPELALIISKRAIALNSAPADVIVRVLRDFFIPEIDSHKSNGAAATPPNDGASA